MLGLLGLPLPSKPQKEANINRCIGTLWAGQQHIPANSKQTLKMVKIEKLACTGFYLGWHNVAKKNSEWDFP